MATLDDIVAATKILDEDSETLMSNSGSKPEEKHGKDINVEKIDNGESVVETENAVENMRSVLNGGEIVSVEGIGGERVDASVLLDGVAGSERNGSASADEGEKQVQMLEDHEHEFRVGDFVWGKIKGHPWWPGQVYDAKDASDFAVKHSQEGRILVAFFGDGSCSWCLSSQLVPFVENFVKMSKDSNSKSFLNAVDRAVNEVGRVMELNMVCSCILEERKGALARPVVAKNIGVKTGVFVPEVDVHRLSVPELEPSEVFAKLVQFAKFDSIGSALELAHLRSWLSAFHRFKGGYELPSYHESVLIEGLEDKNQTVDATASYDLSVPIEVPIVGPMNDDLSSPLGSAGKSQHSSGDKTYHRQKQKSIAELMATDLGKSSLVRKRKKSSDEEIDGGGVEGASLTGKRGKKRKTEVVNDESSAGDVHAKSEGPSKPMEVEISGDNTSSDAKEDAEIISSPRERKKSKYLSPPFTSHTLRTVNGRSKRKSAVESDGRMVVHEAGASGEPVAAPSVPESVNLDDGQQERLDDSVNVNTETAHKEKKLTFPASDVDASVYEVLAEIQFAAIDPLHLRREGSLDMVWDFVSALRSSTFLRGSNYKAYRRSITGKKRKSGPSQLGNQKEEKVKSRDERTPKALKTEGRKDKSKSKEVAEVSASKDSAQKGHRKTLPFIIVTFTPEFPLPSKEEIVSLFGKFGSLNEKRTKVVTDSHSAKVVFVKDSDAESAFRSSVTQGPFGLNANYRLKRSSSASKSRPKVSSPILKGCADKPDGSGPADDLVSDVRGVTKKLEIMTAILENYHSKFSAEDRSSLKDDLKELMEKVENVSEKVETASEKVKVMAESSQAL